MLTLDIEPNDCFVHNGIILMQVRGMLFRPIRYDIVEPFRAKPIGTPPEKLTEVHRDSGLNIIMSMGHMIHFNPPISCVPKKTRLSHAIITSNGHVNFFSSQENMDRYIRLFGGTAIEPVLGPE